VPLSWAQLKAAQQAMIEDFAEEVLTVSSGEGSFSSPLSRRCGMGALPATDATTPWLKDILDINAAQ
jgi:hypothetical protein